MTKENGFDYFLVVFIVLFTFAMTTSLAIIDIPANNRDVIMTLIGAIVAKFVTVIDFRFGSSVGSRDKTQMLNEKSPKNGQ